MDHIEQIRKLATDVRQIMENLKKDGKLETFGYPFNKYPIACCGVMSVIFAHIIQEHGFGSADYVLGQYYNEANGLSPSHAWLKLDGLCIDITADQFEDENYDGVIVVAEENYLPKRKFIPDGKPYSVSFNDNESLVHQLILNELKQLKVIN